MNRIGKLFLTMIDIQKQKLMIIGHNFRVKM